MRRTRFPSRRTALLAWVALGCGGVEAAGPATRQFKAPGGVAMQFGVLPGWIDVNEGGGIAGGSDYSLYAREPAGPVSMGLRLRPDRRGRPSTDDTLRTLVTTLARPFANSVADKTIDLRPLGGGTNGYVATLTDASDDAGRYPCATVFGLRFDGGTLSGTILHPRNSTRLPAALDLLRTATFTGPATRPSTAPSTQLTPVRMRSPDATWTFLIDLPGKELAPPVIHDSADGSRLAVTTDADMICIIIMGENHTPGDAKAAARVLWRAVLPAATQPASQPATPSGPRGALPRRVIPPPHLVESGDGRLALLTYDMPNGARYARGLLVHDDVWVQINLSVRDGTDADATAMLGALRTARVEPIADPTTAPDRQAATQAATGPNP